MSAYLNERSVTPATVDEGFLALVAMILTQASDDVATGIQKGAMDATTLEQLRPLQLRMDSNSARAVEIESIQARDWLRSAYAGHLTHLLEAASGVSVNPGFFLNRARRLAAA